MEFEVTERPPKCKKTQSEESKRIKSERQKSLRQKRVRSGICATCGVRKAELDKTSCKICLSEAAVYSKRLAQSQVKKGVCCACNKAPIFKSHVCENCYPKVKSTIERVRELRHIEGKCISCGKERDSYQKCCTQCINRRGKTPVTKVEILSLSYPPRDGALVVDGEYELSKDIERNQLNNIIRQKFQSLKIIEQFVLKRRFIDELSEGEVASILKRTRARIHQIETVALYNLARKLFPHFSDGRERPVLTRAEILRFNKGFTRVRKNI